MGKDGPSAQVNRERKGVLKMTKESGSPVRMNGKDIRAPELSSWSTPSNSYSSITASWSCVIKYAACEMIPPPYPPIFLILTEEREEEEKGTCCVRGYERIAMIFSKHRYITRLFLFGAICMCTYAKMIRRQIGKEKRTGEQDLSTTEDARFMRTRGRSS